MLVLSDSKECELLHKPLILKLLKAARYTESEVSLRS